MREHESEPVWGLPGRPPAGEQLIWQGAPDWRSLARHGFYHRTLSVYLSVLVAWSGVVAFPLTMQSAASVARNVGLAMAALGLVALYAWLTARSTAYTITNQRVVIRFGIALPVTINLPFRMVNAADVRLNADGTGDLSLALLPGQRVAYLLLWPHARPWRIGHAQPSLRGIADAGRVAQLLGRALAASADQAALAQPTAAVAKSASHAAAVA